MKHYAFGTGASRGNGKSSALGLAEHGYDIVLTCRSNREAADAVAAEIQELGRSTVVALFDVGDVAMTEDVVGSILNEWGCPKVLVNNAGVTSDGLFVRMKPEAWDQVIQTNLGGFYALTRPVIKHMLKERFGRIINIASTSGQRGNPGQVNYAASKAGLIGATKALALEVAKRNITVNAVSPGFIATEMSEDLNNDELLGMIPAGRLGSPEDVAACVRFLASEGAAYVTGQVLGVNGGLYT